MSFTSLLGRLVDSAFLLAAATGLLYLGGYAFFASSHGFRGLPPGEVLLDPPVYVHQGFLVLVVLGIVVLLFLVLQPRGEGPLRGWGVLTAAMLAYHAGYMALAWRERGGPAYSIRDLAPPLLGVLFLLYLWRLGLEGRRFSLQAALGRNDPKQAFVVGVLCVAAVLSMASATAAYSAAFSTPLGIAFRSPTCDEALDGKVFRLLVHVEGRFYVKDEAGRILVVEEREGLVPELLPPDEEARERTEEQRRAGMTPEELAADRRARGSACAPAAQE